MTDLYIIRHGEAYSNVAPYVIEGPRTCRGLTERGFAQARALGERLATGEIAADVLYASTIKRASQTAEFVSEALRLPISWSDELHELRPGEADGMSLEQARERYTGFHTFFTQLHTPLSPGGESWGSFLLRVSTELERIIAANQGRKIVVVAHGGVVEISFLYMLGLGPQARSRLAFHVRNTSITHWRHTDSGDRREWQLVCHNDHAHLRGTDL